MANIKLNTGEELIKASMSNCIAGKMNVKQGTIFLTSDRIVFHKRGLFLQMMIGVFAYLSKGKFDFDIPLDSISEIYKGKHGLNSKVFCIKTINNVEYKFIVKFDDWFEALKNTYIAFKKLRLTENGDNKWIVS